MYPSSTSSSSHGSMGPPTSGAATTTTTTNGGGGGGGGGGGSLMRYGSAPSAFLSTAVESVTGRTSREFSSLESNLHHHGRQYQPHNFTAHPTRFFPMENSSFGSDQSSCKSSNNNNNNNNNTSSNSSTTTSGHNHSSGEQHRNGRSINTTIGLQRSSYGTGLQQDAAAAAVAIGGSEMISSANTSTSPLVRHSSSPAGFLNHLAHAAASTNENGFSITRGHGITRLNSKMRFTRQEPLSQISEENDGLNRDHEQKKGSHSYDNINYGVGSWEDGNSIMFSVGTSKRDKNIDNDIVNSLSNMETQFQFSMPHAVIEMGTMDNLLNIPQDSVPCKIRAKRGCATHPRSIAERERRTRISGKLKKLQELVPNMDKQTSYADMLDLAVQHIKGLQNQVQKLNKELDHCKCGCRKLRNAGGEEKS